MTPHLLKPNLIPRTFINVLIPLLQHDCLSTLHSNRFHNVEQHKEAEEDEVRPPNHRITQ